MLIYATEDLDLFIKVVIEHENKKQPVLIQSIVGDDWDYTGNYRAIINGSSITELSIDDNIQWFEKDKGHTDLANKLGNLIENYFE